MAFPFFREQYDLFLFRNHELLDLCPSCKFRVCQDCWSHGGHIRNVFLDWQCLFRWRHVFFDGPEDYDQIRLWIFYLLFTAGMPFLFILTKDIKWDSYIGEISYPLYLVHGFIIGSLNYLRFGPSVKLAIIIVATLAISTALFVFVDRPVDRFRHKLTASPRAIGVRSSPYRSIKYSLSAVPVLLLLLVISRPTTEASPVPHSIKEVGRYNIVVFNGKVYGIPQGIAVNWQKDDLLAIRGVLVSTTVENTEQLIVTSLKNFQNAHNYEFSSPQRAHDGDSERQADANGIRIRTTSTY